MLYADFEAFKNPNGLHKAIRPRSFDLQFREPQKVKVSPRTMDRIQKMKLSCRHPIMVL